MELNLNKFNQLLSKLNIDKNNKLETFIYKKKYFIGFNDMNLKSIYFILSMLLKHKFTLGIFARDTGNIVICMPYGINIDGLSETNLELLNKYSKIYSNRTGEIMKN